MEQLPFPHRHPQSHQPGIAVGGVLFEAICLRPSGGTARKTKVQSLGTSATVHTPGDIPAVLDLSHQLWTCCTCRNNRYARSAAASLPFPAVSGTGETGCERSPRHSRPQKLVSVAFQDDVALWAFAQLVVVHVNFVHQVFFYLLIIVIHILITPLVIALDSQRWTFQ